MNKGSLIKKAAGAAGCSVSSTKQAVNAFLEALTEAIASGETVTLTGFGKFSPKQISARVRKDFITGEFTQEPSISTMKFKPSKVIRRRLNR